MSDFLQRCLRAAAAFVLSACAATAAFGPAAVAAAGIVRDPVAVEQARAAMQAAVSASRAAAGARSVPGKNGVNDVFANPYRAYPASCLSDGLPFGIFQQSQSDPQPQRQQLTLPGDPLSNSTAEQNYSETVTISVWRVPCSPDSNGVGQSATVIEIDRPCGACDQEARYPTFPLVLATQGNTSNFAIRLTADQNTWFSTSYVNEPIYSSNIWVLENYFLNAVQFDYNQAFALSLDNTITFNLPAYNPAQYAGTSQSLPISGYMTSNWYSPGHGGEGMLTQIFDNGDQQTRTFTAAWYTFDVHGLPFWLYAQGSFTIGDRSTGAVDTYYPTGGAFAGTGGSATFVKWGTVMFSFPDCDHMVFTFNGNADAVQGPTGSGQRTWLRIANVNSLVCD